MEDEKNNKVEEPVVAYKKITVSTLEEQSNLQRKYWSSLSPEERFDNFYQLMNRFYKFQTKIGSGNKIIIHE